MNKEAYEGRGWGDRGDKRERGQKECNEEELSEREGERQKRNVCKGKYGSEKELRERKKSPREEKRRKREAL